MSNKKQERLVREVILELGGQDVEVCYTSKGHQSFYFNFEIATVLHRINRPITIGGTPGRSVSGRYVKSLVRSQMRHHSEPVKKD